MKMKTKNKIKKKRKNKTKTHKIKENIVNLVYQMMEIKEYQKKKLIIQTIKVCVRIKIIGTDRLLK